MRDFKKTLTVGVATFGLVASLGISPAVAADTPTRLAGGDRIGTAVEVAAHAFAGQKPAVVYVAGSSNRNLVDATTAGKLADGPLLYAPSDPTGATRLGKTLAASPVFSGVKRVVAIGGIASVHEGIVKSLASSLKTAQVSRLSGADRYETSVAIAKYALAQAKAGNQAYATMLGKGGQARAVYLANGDSKHLVDSMVAGTLGDGPTILTRPDGSLPETAKTLLAEAKPANVTGLGGAAAISDTAIQQAAAVAGTKNTARLGGSDRFATAAQIAARYTQVYGAPAEVYVAGSEAAADAIIGGQLKRGPILLVAPNGTTTATTQALQAINKATGGKTKILGLGGKNTLPDQALKTATNPTKPAEKKPSTNDNSSSSSSNSSSGGSAAGSSSGSSSSGSSSGSTSSPTPSKPNTPAPTPSAPNNTPTVHIGKTTLNIDSQDQTEVKVMIGNKVDERASVQISPNPPNLLTETSSGVFSINTDSSRTQAGVYTIKVTTGNGQVLPEQKVTMQKKHAALPNLEEVLNVRPGNGVTIAEFAGGHNDPSWGFISDQVKELKAAGYTDSTNAEDHLKLEILNPSNGITSSDLDTIRKHLRVTQVPGQKYVVTADIPSTLSAGDSFTVRVWVEGKGFYLDSTSVSQSVTIASS